MLHLKHGMAALGNRSVPTLTGVAISACFLEADGGVISTYWVNYYN